ncbi:hypothetical protein HID58_085525, partial [Brassica napus]
IVKSIPSSWRKRLQSAPAKLLLLSSSDMFHQGQAIPPCSLGFFISGKLTRITWLRGFIGQNRRNQYEKELQRGRIYTLTNFYASNSKVMYHVADQRLVICISHASALPKDEEDIEGILTERFRLKDGPVINVYLWDEAAVSFRLKFDASEATPTVLLVTTFNPKSLGGKLCLSSMSSSRLFLDEDVDPTREYLTWLTTNPSATSLVNLVEVVKAETLTISEIAAFLKRCDFRLPTLTALPQLMMSSLALSGITLLANIARPTIGWSFLSKIMRSSARSSFSEILGKSSLAEKQHS